MLKFFTLLSIILWTRYEWQRGRVLCSDSLEKGTLLQKNGFPKLVLITSKACSHYCPLWNCWRLWREFCRWMPGFSTCHSSIIILLLFFLQVFLLMAFIFGQLYSNFYSPPHLPFFFATTLIGLFLVVVFYLFFLFSVDKVYDTYNWLLLVSAIQCGYYTMAHNLGLG